MNLINKHHGDLADTIARAKAYTPRSNKAKRDEFLAAEDRRDARKALSVTAKVVSTSAGDAHAFLTIDPKTLEEAAAKIDWTVESKVVDMEAGTVTTTRTNGRIEVSRTELTTTTITAEAAVATKHIESASKAVAGRVATTYSRKVRAMEVVADTSPVGLSCEGFSATSTIGSRPAVRKISDRMVKISSSAGAWTPAILGSAEPRHMIGWDRCHKSNGKRGGRAAHTVRLTINEIARITEPSVEMVAWDKMTDDKRIADALANYGLDRLIAEAPAILAAAA